MKIKLLLLLLLANFSIYAQINLVSNGGFENWTNSTTLPNWTTENNVSQNTTDYTEGINSIKLSFEDNTVIPKVTTQVPMNAGNTYTIKFKYKYLSNNYNNSHPIALNIGKNGTLTTLAITTFATDNDWKTVETTFTADSDFVYDLNFYLSPFENIPFSALIDDVSVYANATEQYTQIPDVNFENKLISLGIDSGEVDGKVLTTNISTIKKLNLYYSSIKDLTGIEAFTSLDTLEVSSNQLQNVDLSKNLALTYLDISYNNLTSLDVSRNTLLEKLYFHYNQVTDINVSKNTNLSVLICTSNQLTTLNLSNNKALYILYCDSNKLTNLDFSKHTTLTAIYCSDNNLTTLDLRNGQNKNMTDTNVNFTKNPSLKCILVDNALYSNLIWSNKKDATASYSSVDCSLATAIPDPKFEQKLIDLGIDTDDLNGSVFNSRIETLTSLDISSSSIDNLTGINGFVSLTDLNCNDNQLSTLDLSKNGLLTSLNCSNNKSLISLNLKNGNNTSFISANLNFTNNPVLTCIQVDDSNYSNTNWFNQKDTTANYNVDCTEYTLLPDPNFEQKLIDLGIDTNGLNGKVATANANKTTYLDLSNSNISNLTGIESFTGLTYLDCSYNTITNVDVSKNTELLKLDLGTNNLATLDLTKNTQLFNLSFSGNQISSIDLSQNKNLHYVMAENNILNNLDLSQNTKLEIIYCYQNNLTELNVKNLPNLLTLNCGLNNLSALDVTQNTKLVDLYCFNNQITSLDLTQNKELTVINAFSNLLTSLDLSQNTKLQIVSVELNPMTTINLQNGNNQNLIIPNLTSKKAKLPLYSNFSNNPTLSCIQVDNVSFSNANWSAIKDPTTIYASTCKTLSLENPTFNNAVLFPNPTKGEITINNVILEKATVYNALGQLVKTVTLDSTNTDHTINLSGLPKGIYYVYLINQDAASAKKIILE